MIVRTDINVLAPFYKHLDPPISILYLSRVVKITNIACAAKCSSGPSDSPTTASHASCCLLRFIRRGCFATDFERYLGFSLVILRRSESLLFQISSAALIEEVICFKSRVSGVYILVTQLL